VADEELKLNGSAVAYNDTELRPRLAPFSTGGFALAFESTLMAAGEQSDVVVRCYSNSVAAIGTGIVANEIVQGNQILPDLAAVSQDEGGFLLVWQDSNSPADGDGTGIVGRFFGPDCKPVAQSFQVNGSFAGNQAEPTVATVEGGAALVAWTDQGVNPSRVMARLVQDGEAIGEEIELVTLVADSAGSAPSLASVDGQWFAAVWQQNLPQGSDPLYSMLGPGGTTLCEPAQASETSSGERLFPAVAGFAGEPGGEFAVAWLSANNGAEGIFLHPVDNGCITQGEDLEVSTGAGISLGAPSLAILDDHTTIVTWSAAGLVGDGDGMGIAARLFDGNGGPLNTAEFTVNSTTAGDQLHPRTADLQDGVYIIVWTSVAPDTGAVNIMARVLNGP